ncbi:ATP-binding protein [Pseudoduganella namucuonensis]|uniref:histidine kinase n=1 Tax=Pseudoduganella namucuonensis TaxID=1035707 RepID=A0A1I7FRG1_9BURK|nr:ATP-binding protein [Pseudoduganella namucuonensis]SFU38763.1 His Kinase A (phospho-acceptor) domain-containing protein [Pseudoduganella namucuonensis]
MIPPSLRTLIARLHGVWFVLLYLLLDWSTYIDPRYGLNITPWNPDTALGLVYWLRHGPRAAVPWFVALVGAEALVRGMAAGPAFTVLGALALTVGYGLIGEGLRRNFSTATMFDNRGRLTTWLAVVAAGILLNSVAYVLVLSLAGLIPTGQWALAVSRFAIGDAVGVLVSMPLIWKLASQSSRERLRDAVWRWESLGYLLLAICVLTAVFGHIARAEYQHFYLLFLPVIWAAARQGVYGAAVIVFVLQLGIITLVKWTDAADISVADLQMLDAVLALVGFFIGIVVDERRQVADELKQTLRLAAAGEMAAALAHELNQPMTALSAYGKACQHLLARGETGPLLAGAIERMIAESGRAAEVVRRLRDFFRTGALRLEAVPAEALLSGITEQFSAQCGEQGVELAVAPAPPVAVLADRLQVELVLRNLLANALDSVAARPPGERRIALSAARLDDGRLRVTVEDNGAGVSEALARRLFEPFVSSKASGLGLGLVLSRAIVEAHGGSLWAEVASHGVFRFILPALESGE